MFSRFECDIFTLTLLQETLQTKILGNTANMYPLYLQFEVNKPSKNKQI